MQLAVQESGNLAGPAIVFIHGLLGSRLNWEQQIASPDLQRYRLITYDLRGHGLSGKPEDAEAYRDGRRYADDLAAVIKATGAHQPVLVGWSLGGVVMSNYLAAYGDGDIGALVYVDGVIELNGAFDHGASGGVRRDGVDRPGKRTWTRCAHSWRCAFTRNPMPLPSNACCRMRRWRRGR